MVEDTNTSYQDLWDAGMSMRVTNAVDKLTKHRGQSYSEYKARVLSCHDAMLVKREDLRTNSDLRRLKGISEKDIARTAKYMVFYSEIEAKLND